MNFSVSHKRTGLTDLHIVSGANGWETVWLPASHELGLEIVPYLGDGRYVIFLPEDIPQLVEELSRLRPWMETHGYDLFIEFIDRILKTFAKTSPEEYEYGFG